MSKKIAKPKKKVAGKKVKKIASRAGKPKAVKKKAKPGRKPKVRVRPRCSKAIDFNNITLRQSIAQLVEHLVDAGYDPILTGAACAAVYVGPSLKPKAINFVIEEYNAAELDVTLGKLGFARSSMNHYESKKAPFDIVFLPPPLAVGDDVVKDIVTAQARPGKFKLLNPTDCVRQRLSMYYRWGERDAFEQAVEVARRHDIDMDLVKRWSEWEWCTDRYDEFVQTLKEKGKA